MIWAAEALISANDLGLGKDKHKGKAFALVEATWPMEIIRGLPGV